MEGRGPLTALSPHEARTAAALFERIFPADENGPGAEEIGAVAYVDRALVGPYRDRVENYRLGLEALDRAAKERLGDYFADCGPEGKDALISDLEHGVLPNFRVPPQRELFWMLREHAREGIFSDPAHGGNRDKMGWKILGHPGVWLEHSAEENLAVEPVTKDGEVLSLADAKFSSSDAAREPVGIPGYDPQKGAEPPSGTADVVLVGVGAVGALIAPVLTRAGLRVVGLEAGPYRTRRDFIPDELGSSYYARGATGQKFLSETPRWRLREGEPTGPAAQMWGLDDFIAAEFDAPAHGFVGGATPNVENQRLPLGVTREALPPDVPAWGQGYKDHVRTWQHWAAVRIQPDTLSYHANFLDLDPRHRDKSGLGLPLVLITYDMQRNEHRLSDWMEGKAQQILHEMGARETWRGPRFGGVMSSHDLGDCRTGEDRQGSVVNPELGVHDTPGLYVFGGAVFPTCHGVNPTLTMWALCYRAAERLIERLHNGEER